MIGMLSGTCLLSGNGEAILDVGGVGYLLGRLFNSAFTAPTDSAAPEAARAEGLSDMMLRNDAISALENLGIPQSDALRAVAAAYNTFAEDPPLDDLIKVALKELSS